MFLNTLSNSSQSLTSIGVCYNLLIEFCKASVRIGLMSSRSTWLGT